MTKRLILFGPLPPPYGGVSVFVSSLFEHLQNYPVQLWALFGNESTDPRITRFNHRRLGVIGALAAQGYKSRIVDFTHFHLEYPHPILLPIWLAAKSLLRFEWYKYILDGSLPDRYPDFSAAQKNRFKKAVGAVDEFIVVSDELRDWLQNEIAVKSPITVVPSLLSMPAEARNVMMSQATNSGLAPLLKHKKRVCSTGAFIPSYGFADVANAIERLRKESGEDIGLLLLDGTFALDVEYRERVLSGRDWITVLANIPNPEVYQILLNCDLFVRAVNREGYGISRVEAIWCGVPVVATDVGETRGMHTFKFGDEEELRRQISEALSGKDSGAIEMWAKQFHQEADENLKKFLDVVGL